MSNSEIIKELAEKNLLVVSKSALLDLMIEANMATKEDARIKYLTAKQVIKQFGVSKYWLRCSEDLTKNPRTRIKRIVGKSQNSTTRYLKQSIIDELKRQEI